VIGAKPNVHSERELEDLREWEDARRDHPGFLNLGGGGAQRRAIREVERERTLPDVPPPGWPRGGR
jgi:hypothetical protein